MEIVVNESNILIDLHTAGLLDLVRRSSVSFHTVDFVIEELHKSPYKRQLIDEMVADGSLYVATTDEQEMAEVVSTYATYLTCSNLSIVDCAVMIYAKKHHYRLLTGDKKLKHHAVDEGVMVSGLLYVVEIFISEALITPSSMADKLEHLLTINTRLPKDVFIEKIESLRLM